MPFLNSYPAGRVWQGDLKFDKRGLIPAVVQDVRNGQVLMVGYLNRESLDRTLSEGLACFYSRSRGRLWTKGETSGNYLRVQDIRVDCDGDTLLVLAEPAGPTCHEGDRSCFHYALPGAPRRADQTEGEGRAAGDRDQWRPTTGHPAEIGAVLEEVEGVLADRKANPREGSYTSSLFSRAPDAICKKIGEEATEVVIASKNADLPNLIHEVADLWFHSLVLLQHHVVPLSAVAAELTRRRKNNLAGRKKEGISRKIENRKYSKT